MRRSLPLSLVVSVLTLTFTAQLAFAGTIVNVNATVNGNPASGHPTVNVSLPAGYYAVTLISGTYKAWSYASYGAPGT